MSLQFVGVIDMETDSQAVGSDPESIFHALQDEADSEDRSTSTVPVDEDVESDEDELLRRSKILATDTQQR